MNVVVIGPGGIGGFYGMVLHSVGCNVKFVARNETLKYLKNNSMKVTHPNYEIIDKIDSYSLDEFIDSIKPKDVDLIILSTKSMVTKEVTIKLKAWLENKEEMPYYLSLQNGVENEDIMCEYYNDKYVIGGLTRLIVSHTISTGHVHCEGGVETLIGAVNPTRHNALFLNRFKSVLDKTQTKTIICDDIKKELWTKLVVNNGVNAICALLEEQTGVLLNNDKTSKIIYELMKETAIASNAVGIDLTIEDAKRMFELYKNFQSVKPSMWVDKENNRQLELEQICGVVIKNCEKQGLDAPYTRTVSTILDFLYNVKKH